MEDNTPGMILIVGKAAIWLLIPLLFGIWEIYRHRRMMRRDAAQTSASVSSGQPSGKSAVAGGQGAWRRAATSTDTVRRAADNPQRVEKTPEPAE